VLPFPTGAEWQHRFSHLVGYGARYYSYLMARSVASSIWQHYFEADPLNSEGGANYRHDCLAHGGGKPSHLLVSDFLGRSVQPEHLAEALIKEIDTKNDLVSKRFSDTSA
jgi:intermediate peptidase